MIQELMYEFLKELDWFYSNRKGYILPIGYEDVIITIIRNASENRWDEVPALLEKLQNMRMAVGLFYDKEVFSDD